MVNNWPRPRINFDTDCVTIVYYPWGAGGKFLINCMSLAPNACLQSNEAATQQIMGDLSVIDKKVYIGNAINAVLDKWNDLHLGATVLTGVDEESYIRLDPSTAQYWSWYSNVSRLTHSGLHFFIDTHTLTHVEAMLKVWPRANVIVIHQSKEFLDLRRHNPLYNNFIDYWETIKGPGWPELPPETWEEYVNAVPDNVKEELSELFDWEFCRFIQPPEVTAVYRQAEQCRVQALRQAYPNNRFLELDGSMYLKWGQTMTGIEQCYDLLDLEDLDSPFINFYYSRWIETIVRTPI